MEPAILYVDDDLPNLDVFRRCLDEQFRVLTASSGPEALEVLGREEVGVLISDQRMDPMTGIELLAQSQARYPLVTRMLLTAYSDRELLLSAIQRGRVDDYLLKPWQTEDVALRLSQGLEVYRRRVALTRAVVERDALRDDLSRTLDPLVGLDRGLAGVGALISRIAPTEATVMVRGESGTGKELIARQIHERSARSKGPFIRINCAAFNEQLLESELFGHEKGAFTSAAGPREGRFEQADGGTLFLDEIGDVSLSIQVKLLRVLQERELERVGGNHTIKVDIRIIAATHRDLETMVKDGTFRSDLFYRLNVVPLQLPPLRERPMDIDALAIHFAQRFSLEMAKRVTLSASALAALRAYDWPGNVRELRNVIERASVLADQQMALEAEDLLFDIGARPALTQTRPPAPGPAPRASVFEEIAADERARIETALRQTGGSITRTARLIGLPRTTLNDRMRKLGLC